MVLLGVGPFSEWVEQARSARGDAAMHGGRLRRRRAPEAAHRPARPLVRSPRRRG